MSLKTYKAKRNFRHTREPAGSKKSANTKSFFVVQKHDATRLHYDFRLAMEGVLKSWAVPKGFPSVKGDRRLAVQVEDHPMDYAKFEGTIPQGNYGAGTVMVWDIGSYSVGGGDPVRALAEGKLHLQLAGKKLTGDWTLVRMKPHNGDEKPQWLLLKSSEDVPPISPREDDRSVLTRRSLQQIAIDNDAQWQSNRIAERAQQTSVKTPKSRRVSAPKKKLPAPKPERSSSANGKLDLKLPALPRRKAGFVEPMKAALSSKLPTGPGWIYELKFDGVRGLAVKEKAKVHLISRNQKDLTAKYPEIAEALTELPVDEAMLDGEVVALDDQGKSSFQLLQAANLPGETRPPLYYYVFDVLQVNGKDLTGLELSKRKEAVKALLVGMPDTIRFSGNIQAQSERVLKEMQARGLEGLIAKRHDSKYEVGRRSGAWVKFKWTNEQEFVIGGYTPPKGTRSHFGAVLVGYYHNGKLLFASKVGTGFDQKLLKLLFSKFQKLRQAECPFSNLPEKRVSRWSGALGLAEMRRCTWVEPSLVCQIRFAEWTRDGHLRQPAFLGLRQDKSARDVVRERATP